MIDGIFIVLMFLAFASFFGWLFVRSLRLGELTVRGGYRSIFIKRAQKPFSFWFNVVGFGIFGIASALAFLFLTAGLLKGQ